MAAASLQQSPSASTSLPSTVAPLRATTEPPPRGPSKQDGIQIEGVRKSVSGIKHKRADTVRLFRLQIGTFLLTNIKQSLRLQEECQHNCIVVFSPLFHLYTEVSSLCDFCVSAIYHVNGTKSDNFPSLLTFCSLFLTG